METYRTEEEQVEALKRWWQENGTNTLIAIALAVAVSFGWRYWQDHQQAEKEAASAVYQDLLTLMSAPDLSDSQRATAGTLIGQLSEQYAGTGYDQLAALASVRLAMDAKEYEQAASTLQQLKGQTLSIELAALVNFRLAKVFFSQQKFGEALTALDGDMQKYAAQAAELRGDILAAQGNNSQAAAAYEDAQNLSSGDDMLRPSPLLRIKIESVASATSGDNA